MEILVILHYLEDKGKKETCSLHSKFLFKSSDQKLVKPTYVEFSYKGLSAQQKSTEIILGFFIVPRSLYFLNVDLQQFT